VGEQVSHDEATVRRRFVTTIALLRAVGNVLYDVDAKTSDAFRKAIDEAWKKEKPPIFTNFIESYRNAVLKRYEHPEIDFDKIMGTLYPHLRAKYGDHIVPLNTLVDKAIQYWEQYLDDVERRAEIIYDCQQRS